MSAYQWYELWNSLGERKAAVAALTLDIGCYDGDIGPGPCSIAALRVAKKAFDRSIAALARHQDAS